MRFFALTGEIRKTVGVNAKYLILKHHTVIQTLNQVPYFLPKLPTEKSAEHIEVVEICVKDCMWSLKVNLCAYYMLDVMLGPSECGYKSTDPDLRVTVQEEMKTSTSDHNTI